MSAAQSQTRDYTDATNAEIKRLQKETKQLLNNSIQLLEESIKTLGEQLTYSSDNTTAQSANAVDYIQDIRDAIEKLDQLQIKVPIIASSKAGKSTIINALIGGDFLPTRANPMTAFPTKVIIKLEQSPSNDVPLAELLLDKETVKGLQTLQSSVAKELYSRFNDNEKLESFLVKNAHLVETAKHLRDSTECAARFQTSLQNDMEARDETEPDGCRRFTDRKNIEFMLTFLNDLVRISMYLAPKESHSSIFSDVFKTHTPMITVNNCPVQNTKNRLKQPCQLVLIDTPGPDEASISTALSHFVDRQLKEADLVFTVGEYTHLGTESGYKLMGDINTIRKLKRDRNCVYVLVSKIDQYKRRDIPKAQLKEHVADFYDVSQEYVFLMSGSYALIAQKFFADYQQSPQNKNQLDIQNSETAKDVLEAYCPSDWEEMLTETKSEEVDKIANRLFEKSNIGDFLKTAIDSVLDQVVQRCVESAINTCKNVVDKLIEAVNFRLHGLEVEEKVLLEEIQALDKDLKDLADIRGGDERIIAEFKEILETKLKEAFDEALRKSTELIKSFFSKSNLERMWSEAGSQRDTVENRSVSRNDVGVTEESVIPSCRESSKSSSSSVHSNEVGRTAETPLRKKLHADVKKILFSNEDDLDQFIHVIGDRAKREAAPIYEEIITDINKVVDEVTKSFHDAIDEKAKPIVDRTSTRLSTTFKVEMYMPIYLKNASNSFGFVFEQVEHSRSLRWWWSLFTCTGPTYKIHAVACSKLIDDNICNIRATLLKLKKETLNETMASMKKHFEGHLKNVQKNIEQYKHYVQQSLTDKHLDPDKKNCFKTELEEFQQKWNNHKREVNGFCSSINWAYVFSNTIRS